MARTHAQEVRRSQKKSFFLREISSLISRLAYDEPLVASIYITRIELSEDGGICYIYFSVYQAESIEEKKALYMEAKDVLVLYKASLRKALAQASQARYVPDLRFLFDESKEKEIRVNRLLTQVGEELEAQDTSDDSSEDE